MEAKDDYPRFHFSMLFKGWMKEEASDKRVKEELNTLFIKLWEMDGVAEGALSDPISLSRRSYWEGHRECIKSLTRYVKQRLDKIEKEC